MLIVCINVDDMIYRRNLKFTEFKVAQKSKFEMTNLGLMKHFVGIKVEQSKNGIFIW